MNRREKAASEGRKQSSGGGGRFKLVTADEALANFAQAYPSLATPGSQIVSASAAQLAGTLCAISNIHRASGRTKFAGGPQYVKVMQAFGAQSFRVGLPAVEMLSTVGSVLLGLLGSRELAVKALQDLCHDAVTLYDQNVDDALHVAHANSALEGLRYVASKQALAPGVDGNFAATVVGIIQAQAMLQGHTSGVPLVAQHLTPVTPAGAPEPQKGFWEKAVEAVADDADGALAGAAVGAVRNVTKGPAAMAKGAVKGAVLGAVADHATTEPDEAAAKADDAENP